MRPVVRMALAASLATSATAPCAAATEPVDEIQPPPRIVVAVERQYYPEVVEFEGGVPVRYACENGSSFAFRFDRVRGTSTAQVRYADGMANEARRTLLLVAGPTGSGIRYTNDEAVLNLKGAKARIEIPETASTDAFAASLCVRAAEVGETTLTQGALAGSYFFAIDRFYPGQYETAYFAKAEVICFITSDADFLALVPAPGEFPARYYVSHGSDLVETGPMLVGEGGDEQRTREVGNAQKEYGCALLELDYERALAEFPEDSKMLEYLKANAPVWR